MSEEATFCVVDESKPSPTPRLRKRAVLRHATSIKAAFYRIILVVGIGQFLNTGDTTRAIEICLATHRAVLAQRNLVALVVFFF